MDDVVTEFTSQELYWLISYSQNENPWFIELFQAELVMRRTLKNCYCAECNARQVEEKKMAEAVEESFEAEFAEEEK